jgi:hypothetical protein
MLGGQTIPPPAPLPPPLDVDPEPPPDVLELLAWLELPVVVEWLDEDPPVAVLLDPEQAPSVARPASAREATKTRR